VCGVVSTNGNGAGSGDCEDAEREGCRYPTDISADAREQSYAPTVTAVSWSWRELPVLEAILRLGRLDQIATLETIAAEAILHLDDVRDGVVGLVDDGYLETLEITTDGGARTTVVSPGPGLRSILHSPRRLGSLPRAPAP
jgi:hypothetical protein